MASTMIHLAVAKKLLNYFKTGNIKDYMLGSIAPDIAKQIGLTKTDSHFLIHTKEDVPNIEMFKLKYPNFKYNSFDLGYFVHLYTDKLWFDGFINNLTENNSIKLMDGTIITTTPEEMLNMIYSDYTNINIQLLDKYEMDLSIFYEEFTPPKGTIKEIPMDKLDILLNKMSILIQNSKEEKPYIFDLYLIEEFIDKAVKEIITELKK